MDVRNLRSRAVRALRLADACGDKMMAAKLRALAVESLEEADQAERPASQQQQQIQPDKPDDKESPA